MFQTLFYNYNEYLEKLCERNEYKDYCRYIDMKAQFDVENNMPSTMMKVNARSTVLEKIGTNGVHPTMEGYLQIGDVFYRALVADMKNVFANESKEATNLARVIFASSSSNVKSALA